MSDDGKSQCVLNTKHVGISLDTGHHFRVIAAGDVAACPRCGSTEFGAGGSCETDGCQGGISEAKKPPRCHGCDRQLGDGQGPCKYCDKWAYCDECEKDMPVASFGGAEVQCLGCGDSWVMAKITVSAIDHPQHYNAGKFEVIEVIQDWKLGFCEGNVVKYVARAEHKGEQLEDLKKARWYLDYRISELEK